MSEKKQNSKFITGTKHGDLLYFFDLIIIDISIQGFSLRKALENRMHASTFYELIDSDPEKNKQYARAIEMRMDKMADDILVISDESSQDTLITEKGAMEDREWVNRSKLRVDSRKWLMSKLAPKKYGDKIDVTSGGEKIDNEPRIIYAPNGIETLIRKE